MRSLIVGKGCRNGLAGCLGIVVVFASLVAATIKQAFDRRCQLRAGQ